MGCPCYFFDDLTDNPSAKHKTLLKQQKLKGSCFHQSPITCCMSRLTPVMPAQQQSPIKIGLPPVLTSLTMLVFSPMAAIATTMKNLLSSLSGSKKLSGKPNWTAIVVTIDAATNQRIKNGNIFRSCTLPPAFSFLPRSRKNASTRVMGIMASVLVSLTVTALSSVAEPSFHMLSQMGAAALA